MRITDENIANCDVRLYRSGMYVIQKGVRRGQNPEKLMQMARKKRMYTISRQKVKSSCIELWRCKRSKHLLFITYTFAFNIQEKDAAAIWQNHCDNIKKTFKVHHYVWVKERQKSGRIHFHTLMDTNRVNILDLQNSFNNSVNHHNSAFITSNNSVRLGNNPIVNDVRSVARYLSKYISKEKTEFESKAYGSTDMILFRNIDFNDFYDLTRNKKCILMVDEPYLKIGVICNYFDIPDG